MNTKKDTKITFPENGRTPEYQEWLQRILDSKKCPFCEEHWPGEHKPPFEKKKYWILTENAVKSDRVHHHWLVILKRHVTIGTELKEEEFSELYNIYKELVNKYKLDHLTFIMRSGSPHTGSTVAHLHVQIFVSKEGEVELTRV